MMHERILITGLGVISPVGCSVDEYWTNLLYARSLPKEYPGLSPDQMRHRLAYLAGEWQAEADPSVGRATALATAATAQALEDAELLDRGGLVVGAALGTATGDHDLGERRRAHGAGPWAYPYSVAAHIGEHFALEGPCLTLSTACAASSYALSLACEALLEGRADAMVVAGVDTISRVANGAFNRMEAADPQICRPFDAQRQGTIYGEGAAVLILEREGSARRRGISRSYGAILGAGWSCDGYHTTAPDPSGAQIEWAIHRAQQQAGLAASAIDCVVCHGTGTELNDLVESQCLERIFGSAVEQMAFCALKSKLGHSAGAAGAFGCLTAALILTHGVVPPTANLRRQDPRCRIPIHSEGPLQQHVRHVLVNAYAFGGNNISIILGGA